MDSLDPILAEQGWAYRIERIPPGSMGREATRTPGHDRSLRPEAGATYPALAHVLSGSGYLLQQRSLLSPESVSDLFLSPLEAGRTALLLPDFGEVLVQRGEEPLIVAVCESAQARHDPEPYRKHRGPAYLPIRVGTEVDWHPNPHWSELPTPRWIQPQPSEPLGIEFGTALDGLLVKNPGRFSWLNRPEDYQDLFAGAYSYFDTA